MAKYPADPLTEEERRFVRKMIEQEKHVAWFWATLRQWAFWTATVVAGIVAFRENLKSIIWWLFK